jgi:thiol-disulfide isomerase/thioredoxin
VGQDTYYFYNNPLRLQSPEESYPNNADEVNTILAALPEILQNVELGERVLPYSDLIGMTVDFDATDISGNPISLPELFSQHEITMINLWASWCGPCREELPFLEELSKTFAEKDCALIGLVVEGDQSSEAASAASLVRSLGLTYPNILPTAENWMEHPLFKIKEIPNTIFVDRSGKILRAPILGSLTFKYEETLNALLEEAK